uniref:Uncharacterized protein n=1 Tax=uncultured bacterium fosmid pJB77G10 TaxID=1478069 RepID=A0A0H3U9U5_9BACT|nr:hypothetical protein [uncultured bacterium fosmid pJB77G10]
MDKMQELLDKANECETAEEMVALCKKYDYEISLKDAELYLNHYDEGEVADEKMDLVSGGDSILADDNGERLIPFDRLRIGYYVYARPKSSKYDRREGMIAHIDSSMRIASIYDDNRVYVLPDVLYSFYIK